jgi:hypothetical protein
VFWSGLFVGSVAWFGLVIWSLLAIGWFSSVLAFFVLWLQVVNVWAFLQCQKSASKHGDEMARMVMLGDAFDSDGLEPEPEMPPRQQPEAERTEDPEPPRLVVPKTATES